jgi:hypothetical protein
MEHAPAPDAERPEAWVDLPSEDDLRALRAALNISSHPYEAFLGGTIPLMARLLAAHPSIGLAFVQLSNEVLFGPGALSRAEREIVASVAAAAQDCVY